MNKKKLLTYALSMSIPVLIFFICATINGFVPMGEELLNSYDSFTQYPGMLLEYARLLRNGNIFYSWGAGLGFNFFGTLAYYAMSPLNLLSLFATPSNFHIFFAIMTFLRFALLGGAMCFYLEKKDVKPLYVVLFSTLYALMGYTSTYYYNFIWIDSVIMLPLVIHGLDKLIEGKSPKFYIIALSITIIINYYIGYMICVFSLIWFLYKLVNAKEKKKLIKTFTISSILAGLIGAISIIPSFFALMTGKASLYDKVDYIGFSRNIFTFFYTLTTGAYQATDQMYGPALIYVGIISIVLTTLYFFNKKFDKREKIATLVIILFFYISFSFNLMNYAWQFFQKPIWWQSRFSFAFSFFLITIAYRTLSNIDKTDMKLKYRILACVLFIISIVIGAKFKWAVLTEVQIYTYIYLGLSTLIFIEMIFLIDKKNFLTMLIVFTLVEVSLNTFNSLKNNYRYKSYTDFAFVKEEVPKYIEKLNSENDSFYRMELMDDFTSDDGLYFGYNGINYFNSVRNISVIELMEKLGVKVYDKCHIELLEFDPVLMSILNIKYLYGEENAYFKKIDRRLYENPHPLALGFMGSSKVKNLALNDEDIYENRQELIKALSKIDDIIYKKISYEEFNIKISNQKTDFSYKFISDKNYLLIPVFDGSIEIDGIKKTLDKKYIEIEKDSEVEITYEIMSEFDEGDVYVMLMDIDNYERHMEALEKSTLKAQTNKDGHILKGTITSTGDYDYMFTTIEYEKGMTVTVDGKKIQPDIVLGTLIGFPLDKGTHEITIDYIPRGIILGSSLSLIGFLGTIFYLQSRKKAL